MSTASRVNRLTFEEYEGLHEDERCELYRGELLPMTPGTPEHNNIRDEIAFALREYVKKHALGRVCIETAFQLAPDIVFIPDVALVTAEQVAKANLKRTAFFHAPVLAIEVVSPGNTALEIARKRELYLSAGAAAVWIIYPEQRKARIYKSGAAPAEQDVLSDEELFPGFSLPLSAVL
jgi:Uma2 family endonuclease